MNTHLATLLIALALSAPVFAAESDRPIIQSVNALEPNQCAADNYIFKAGEQHTFEDGVTRQCTEAKPYGEWVAVPNSVPAN